MNNHFIRRTLLASALTLIIGCSPKTPEELIANAEQYIAAGDNNAALIELKNAVAKDPSIAEARFLLGKMFFATGQLASAEKEFNKALELGVSIDEIAPWLVKTYYHSDQFQVLESFVNRLQATDPDSVSESNMYLILNALNQGGTQVKSLIEKVENQLNERDRSIAKVVKYYQDNQLELAREEADQLIKSQTVPAVSHYLSALIYIKNNNFGEAVNDFKNVISAVPAINRVTFQLIEALINAKRVNEAEQEIARLLKINKQQPLLNLFQARVDYDKEQYDKALSYAEIAIQNGADNMTSRMIAGVSAYKVQNFEKAYRHLINLHQRSNVENDNISRLLAHVQLKLGYNQEAVASLNAITALNNEDAELFALTGMQLASLGEVNSAKELLNKASSIDGENVAVKLRQALVNIGTDEKLVISNLEDVIKEDEKVSQGWAQLALAHLRSGDKQQAIKVAQEWQSKSLSDGKALEGIVYLQSGDFEQAVIAFNEAIASDPVHIGANVYLLESYQRLGNYDKTYAQAKSILTFDVNSVPAIVSLVRSAKELNFDTQVVKYLQQLNVEQPKEMGPKLALALNARINSNPQKTIEILSAMQQLNSLGYATLGDTYLQTENIVQALNTYKKWQESNPEFILPRLRVIGIYELQGKYQLALEATMEALRTFPNKKALQLLQLNYLTLLHKNNQANNVLEELKTDVNATSKDTDLLNYYEGQLALSEKDYVKAEKNLLEHHLKSPSSTSAAMLAKAMLANGNVDGAKGVLEQQLEKAGTSAKYKYMVADFYSYNQFYDEAIALYKSMQSKEQDNLAIANNLAYNQYLAGQFDEAKVSAAKAMKLAPNMPEVIDTMAMIEFKLGNIDEAYRLIITASNLQPESPSINLHLAEILISLDQNEKARSRLLKIKNGSSAELQARDALFESINN